MTMIDAFARAGVESGAKALRRILDQVLDANPAGLEAAVANVLARLDLTPAARAAWDDDQWFRRIARLLNERTRARGGDLPCGNVPLSAAPDLLAGGAAPGRAGGRGECLIGNDEPNASSARPDPYRAGVAVLGNLWWDTLRINGQPIAELTAREARDWAAKHVSRADYLLRLTEGLPDGARIGDCIGRDRAAAVQNAMESEGRYA